MQELQWKQPVAYRRAVYREFRRLNPFLFQARSGLLFGTLLAFGGMFFVTSHAPLLYWLIFVVCALLVSQLVYRFLPLSSGFGNLTIILSEAGVQTFRFLAFQRIPGELWPWERVGRCRAALKEIAGQKVPVLIIESWESREMATFGLGQRPNVAEIRNWLKGVQRELLDETEARRQAIAG